MHSTEFIIREATYEDISDIAQIEEECFSLPWSESAIKESMKMNNYIFLVAEAENDIAGYMGLYIAADEGDITNIAVKSSYRKKGIAKSILEAMIKKCNEQNIVNINLEVRESNIPAINLYTKLKFEKLGIRKNFYEKPNENAVIMQKQL